MVAKSGDSKYNLDSKKRHPRPRAGRNTVVHISFIGDFSRFQLTIWVILVITGGSRIAKVFFIQVQLVTYEVYSSIYDLHDEPFSGLEK